VAVGPPCGSKLSTDVIPAVMIRAPDRRLKNPGITPGCPPLNPPGDPPGTPQGTPPGAVWGLFGSLFWEHFWGSYKDDWEPGNHRWLATEGRPHR
jgi:hypothetical protein